MPKASIALPDGTQVQIEGSTDEIERLLQLYSGGKKRPEQKKSPKSDSEKKQTGSSNAQNPNGENSVEHAEIVNTVHDCDEAQLIAHKILDKKNVLNRVLLPLYVVHEYFDKKWGLTSGDVQTITKDLGVRVSTSNASGNLSGAAKKYVTADIVRKKGKAVRYELNRPGIQYMKKLLSDG